MKLTKMLRGLPAGAFMMLFCQTTLGYPQTGHPTTGSLINQGAPSKEQVDAKAWNDYQMQQAADLQAARAAAQAAFEKKLAQDLVERARWDEAVGKLTGPRDAALQQLDLETDLKLADLKSQSDKLESEYNQLMEKETKLLADTAHQQALQYYRPNDPWRIFDGKLCYAKGPEWFEFIGEVQEVKPTGILMHGHFGPPLEADLGERDYFVMDFPYKVADGEKLTSGMHFVAHASGDTYTITNNNRINGGVHTVRGLLYGKAASAPPAEVANKLNPTVLSLGANHPEIDQQITDWKNKLASLDQQMNELKRDYAQKCADLRSECDHKITVLREEFARQIKDEAEAKAKAAKDRVLKFNQEQADKGDAVGLLRMAQRYRDGDDVPKDPAKSKIYFQKAAEAGSVTAAEELKKMPDEPANP